MDMKSWEGEFDGLMERGKRGITQQRRKRE